MVGFFRNMFQQTGFIPTEDFKMQLLQNGGFDFGGSTRNVGDDAFPRLVQNLQDSFALTAWQLVKEGRPFTETLTTHALPDDDRAQEPLRPDRDAGRHEPALDVDDGAQLDDRLFGHRRSRSSRR